MNLYVFIFNIMYLKEAQPDNDSQCDIHIKLFSYLLHT